MTSRRHFARPSRFSPPIHGDRPGRPAQITISTVAEHRKSRCLQLCGCSARRWARWESSAASAASPSPPNPRLSAHRAGEQPGGSYTPPPGVPRRTRLFRHHLWSNRESRHSQVVAATLAMVGAQAASPPIRISLATTKAARTRLPFTPPAPRRRTLASNVSSSSTRPTTACARRLDVPVQAATPMPTVTSRIACSSARAIRLMPRLPARRSLFLKGSTGGSGNGVGPLVRPACIAVPCGTSRPAAAA